MTACKARPAPLQEQQRRASRGNDRGAARSSASGVAPLRRIVLGGLGKALRGTAGRFSTRMYRTRSRCGTSGRRSPACPWHSSRLRQALCWTGEPSVRCANGIGFATVTLAAGISSTGDAELDRRLPFDEPYRIPESTASAIRRAQAEGGRIVAIGTTVVRALETPWESMVS